MIEITLYVVLQSQGQAVIEITLYVVLQSQGPAVIEITAREVPRITKADTA